MNRIEPHSRPSLLVRTTAIALASLIGMALFMPNTHAEEAKIQSALRDPPRARDPLESRLSGTIASLLKGLDPDQRKRVLYRFDDAERFDLRLAPLGLEGLRVDEMTEAQWADLHEALGTLLSKEGLQKADTIRSLEREVAEVEGGLFGFFFDRIRNSKRYFLAVFGTPAPLRETGTGVEPWGLRFDGHHLSLNWTAVTGSPPSATPLFFGSQPRQVPEGLERAGLRVLPEEEDAAVEFIAGLTALQRDAARIGFSRGSQIRRPMFVGGDAELDLEASEGLVVGDLAEPQRAIFDRLVHAHLSNFAAPIARRYRDQLLRASDRVHFAYAVPEAANPDREALARVGAPLYYRIQSPEFLIEFDNTAAEADHIHVVIRSIDGDFGRDLLTGHYALEH